LAESRLRRFQRARLGVLYTPPAKGVVFAGLYSGRLRPTGS